jgi:GNAT superfamily N-acetyltransferase
MRKQEKGFISHLFESYIDKPQVYAIFDKKKLVGVIEGSLEAWNNCFRIINFLVDKKYRNEGFGKMLFKHMVDEDKQSVVLNQNIVKDANLGVIFVNAKPILRLPRVSKNR